MFMSKTNDTYKTAISLILIRMIKYWSGTQKDLEKEIKTLVEIIYEDGQNSVKGSR